MMFFSFIVIYVGFCSLIATAQTYYYTGYMQNFSVPVDVEALTVEACGANGGMAGYSGTQGFGGCIKCTVLVKGNSSLYIYVGGVGTSIGGYNGGGAPNYYDMQSSGGGGSTDIRTTFSLSDRKLFYQNLLSNLNSFKNN
jgi:hypothetical protein